MDHDSFSSGSDSGFCHQHKKLSYCSRCSSEKTSSKLLRRHSRASSVDRREIFNKYIQKSSEHSESVRPFSSDDPELEKDRNQDEFLLEPNTTLKINKKEFRLVRLPAFNQENLGIFIARQSQVDIGCHGYFVAHIVPNGLVKR